MGIVVGQPEWPFVAEASIMSEDEGAVYERVEDPPPDGTHDGHAAPESATPPQASDGSDGGEFTMPNLSLPEVGSASSVYVACTGMVLLAVSSLICVGYEMEIASSVAGASQIITAFDRLPLPF